MSLSPSYLDTEVFSHTTLIFFLVDPLDIVSGYLNVLYLKGYTREPTLNHNFLLAIFLSYKLCYQGVLIYLETSHLKGYLMGNPIYVFYNPLAYLAILMCSTSKAILENPH